MFLDWLASFLSGPLLGDALDAYKAKLSAGNTSEGVAADLLPRKSCSSGGRWSFRRCGARALVRAR